jgi:hypothetical protein
LPPSSVPDLEAPSVVTAAVVGGVCTLSYAAPVSAGTSLEIDYYNGTGLYQDITTGSLSALWTPG